VLAQVLEFWLQDMRLEEVVVAQVGAEVRVCCPPPEVCVPWTALRSATGCPCCMREFLHLMLELSVQVTAQLSAQPSPCSPVPAHWAGRVTAVGKDVWVRPMPTQSED
jgi:hypothetical protein